jgi:hypothetical protein
MTLQLCMNAHAHLRFSFISATSDLLLQSPLDHVMCAREHECVRGGKWTRFGVCALHVCVSPGLLQPAPEHERPLTAWQMFVFVCASSVSVCGVCHFGPPAPAATGVGGACVCACLGARIAVLCMCVCVHLRPRLTSAVRTSCSSRRTVACP